MWPFKRKPVEPQLEEPRTEDLTVYVRDLMMNVDVNDALLIAMSLSNNVCWLTNNRSPDFPHLLEPQYQALPSHCKVYFVPRVVSLPIVSEE